VDFTKEKVQDDIEYPEKKVVDELVHANKLSGRLGNGHCASVVAERSHKNRLRSE
jgi:hypothetical protein